MLGIKASNYYLGQVAIIYYRGISMVRNFKFLTPFSKFLIIKLFTHHYNLLLNIVSNSTLIYRDKYSIFLKKITEVLYNIIFYKSLYFLYPSNKILLYAIL